jgi:hypothetical protein
MGIRNDANAPLQRNPGLRVFAYRRLENGSGKRRVHGTREDAPFSAFQIRKLDPIGKNLLSAGPGASARHLRSAYRGCN